MLKINNISNKMHNKQIQPSFSGNLATLGEKIVLPSSSKLKGFSDAFEYNKFNMPLASIMTLLYGFTIVPRYFQAKDKYDKREILTRDLLSISAILFLANGLSSTLTKMFTKKSGFALNEIPSKYAEANPIKKLWYHLKPGGLELLSSKELSVKYSNLEGYKNGISDFFCFIKKHGGDVSKVLSYKGGKIKQYADAIVGKDVKSASFDEITQAFEKAKGSKALAEIYKAFKDPNNNFVKHAKTMNSFFNCLAMIVLTPLFMIWIEKFNEKVTKKQIAKEKAMEAKKANTPEPVKLETVKADKS